MDETEFKKLASNSRDWLIYNLLSEVSKEGFIKEITITAKDDLPADIYTNPKGETSVQETIKGKAGVVTDKAVLMIVGKKGAWFPKSVIENLDKVVLEQGKMVEFTIAEWFKYKVKWEDQD